MSDVVPETKTWDNSYFEGKVRSRNIVIDGKRATEGEIDPGSYTFPTGSAEQIKITEGTAYITPPGGSRIKLTVGQQITIPANSQFQIMVIGKTAKYECIYLDEEPDETEVDTEIDRRGDELKTTLT